jgi:hypothetical protein
MKTTQLLKWDVIGACVRKVGISLLLGLLLVLVTQAQAGYTDTQTFSLPENESDYLPWKTQLEFDLSQYSGDLSQITNWTLSFSNVNLTSQMLLYRSKADAYGNVIKEGDYVANLMYQLGITVAGRTISDYNTLTPLDPNAVYRVKEDVVLNVKEETAFDQFGYSELQFNWLSEGTSLSSLLNNDGKLIFELTYIGLDGSLDFGRPEGTTIGFETISLGGNVVLSFDTPAATPEPATFLMFGAAMVIGLPMIRRMRRK